MEAMKQGGASLRIGAAVVIILGVIAYLAVTGVKANKSYYVTISELQGMGGNKYTRHLRVAGNVQPGSIHRVGSNAQFTLVELGRTLPVDYQGAEPPPDTFKDNAQALAIGTFGRDGVFHANQIQAKCASKYAPAQQNGGGAQTSASNAPSASGMN